MSMVGQGQLDHSKYLGGWFTPEGLGAVVSSLEELKKKLPPTQSQGEVFLEHQFKGDGLITKGYDCYSRNVLDHPVHVAHGCPECKKITIGYPRLETFDTISGLAGRKGAYLFCANPECGARLYEFIEMVS